MGIMEVLTKKSSQVSLLGTAKGQSYLQKHEHVLRQVGERAWACSNSQVVGTWIFNRENRSSFWRGAEAETSLSTTSKPVILCSTASV